MAIEAKNYGHVSIKICKALLPNVEGQDVTTCYLINKWSLMVFAMLGRYC